MGGIDGMLCWGGVVMVVVVVLFSLVWLWVGVWGVGRGLRVGQFEV